LGGPNSFHPLPRKSAPQNPPRGEKPPKIGAIQGRPLEKKGGTSKRSLKKVLREKFREKKGPIRRCEKRKSKRTAERT